MSGELSEPSVPEQQTAELQGQSARMRRIWPMSALLAIYWSMFFGWRYTEIGFSFGFKGFLAMALGSLLVTISFIVWWLKASGLPRFERLGGLAFAAVGAVCTGTLAHRSLGPFLIVPGISLVPTVWTAAYLVSQRLTARTQLFIVACALWATLGSFMLLRADGMTGGGKMLLRWRWTPSAEASYLSERVREPGDDTLPASQKDALTAHPGDWPGFRGPNRDGVVTGVRLATDWDKTPPKLLWKRRIGPGWSAMAVVGNRLFTQEQVGPDEAVSSIDTAVGQTLWTHVDKARYEDVQTGAGPRATPTFAEGLIFALGATGILNCLDAKTGAVKWTHDITAEAGTTTPQWGFSSSPLVANGLVIVFAGESAKKSLLAYSIESGELKWSAAAGKSSYSSPQLASIFGKAQLLFTSDEGLFAFDPASGSAVWQHAMTAPGNTSVVQPHLIGTDSIIFGAGPDYGTALVKLTIVNGAWAATEQWVSRRMKPSFNDFVIYDGAIFGFDGRYFTCLDLETGERLWRQGRYGSGQVLLLADQALLLVVSEEGQLVLVEANRKEHHELGSFQAVEGKTWNHPVIAHGRLFIRNAEEIACYELTLDDAPLARKP